MRYSPAAVPSDTPRSFADWIARELRMIAAALSAADTVELQILAVEPARPREGMIVYADGSLWDPGSGAGFYGYESGAWVKL